MPKLNAVKKVFLVLLVPVMLFGCEGGQATNEPTPAELDAHLTPRVLPATGSGQVFFSDRPVGRISIKTRATGAHVWIKVVNYPSQRKVAAFFIRSGGSFTVNVPRGTYQIKMASGKTWYGSQDLFGSQTSYSMADDTFPISSGDEWSVELIPQVHGNLREKTIDAVDF